MRKIFYLAPVLFALALLLVSCTGWTDTGTTPATTTAATTESTTTVPPVTTAPSPYEGIDRRPSTSFQTTVFAYKNDNVLLKISRPVEWEIMREEEGFAILRDGVRIGSLCGGNAGDTAGFSVLESKTLTVGDIRVTKYIEKGSGEGELRFRYVYKYPSNGYVRAVTLTADYREVDETLEDRLYKNLFTEEKFESDTLGVLNGYFENHADIPSVLIRGNSCIGTSKIGNRLKEMLKNGEKDCTVTAYSRGYARVGTYVNDSSVMASIRAGLYTAVFICGFYGEDEIENLGILKAACDASGTALVIFPAHNEGASIVQRAMATYPSLLCLNWKAELDGLIADGVDRWSLCIDDAHLHSTPLAGYVGAHMIYRALWGEMPFNPVSNTLGQDYIDSILGEYAYAGDAKVYDALPITYLD